MLVRIEELFARHGGRKVSLVGWSLGGLYVRQLAKIAPDKVRCMISLGSPFAGSPKSTNAWRAYEWANGSKADDERLPAGLAENFPVPHHVDLQSHGRNLRLARLSQPRRSHE